MATYAGKQQKPGTYVGRLGTLVGRGDPRTEGGVGDGAASLAPTMRAVSSNSLGAAAIFAVDAETAAPTGSRTRRPLALEK